MKEQNMMEKDANLSDVIDYLSEPEERQLMKSIYIDKEISVKAFLLRKTIDMKRCNSKWLDLYAQDTEFLNDYYFPVLMYYLKNPTNDDKGNKLPNRRWDLGHHVKNNFEIRFGDFDPDKIIEPYIKKFKVSRTLYNTKSKFQINEEILNEYINLDRKSSSLFLYKRTKDFYERFVDIESKFVTGQVVWGFGTWVFNCFNSFPMLFYMAFTGSGKTRAMLTESLICSNPWTVTLPTLSSLVRTIHANTPSVFIDETEKYVEKDSQEFINILNSGFGKGSPVSKTNKDTHQLEEFDIYCPKALASTKDMPLTIQNRSFYIPLKKTLKTKEFSKDPCKSDTEDICKDLLFWSIDNGSDILSKYENEDFSPEYQKLLTPIKNARLRNQAMIPIITIADILGIHGIEGEMELLTDFIKYQCEIAEEETLDPLTLRVISVLYHLAPSNGSSEEFTVKKIMANMDISDNEKKWVTNQKIGYVLRSFHLKHRKVGGYPRYTVNQPMLDEIAQRYNIDYGDVGDIIEEIESTEKKGLDKYD